MSQPWLRASIKITKPIILIDMDGVICDFDKRAAELELQGIKGHSLFKHPSAYKDLEPIEGAISVSPRSLRLDWQLVALQRARIARRAADNVAQFVQFDEVVALAAQFV
jgi:hypothetical protein